MWLSSLGFSVCSKRHVVSWQWLLPTANYSNSTVTSAWHRTDEEQRVNALQFHLPHCATRPDACLFHTPWHPRDTLSKHVFSHVGNQSPEMMHTHLNYSSKKSWFFRLQPCSGEKQNQLTRTKLPLGKAFFFLDFPDLRCLPSPRHSCFCARSSMASYWNLTLLCEYILSS